MTTALRATLARVAEKAVVLDRRLIDTPLALPL